MYIDPTLFYNVGSTPPLFYLSRNVLIPHYHNRYIRTVIDAHVYNENKLMWHSQTFVEYFKPAKVCQIYFKFKKLKKSERVVRLPFNAQS